MLRMYYIIVSISEQKLYLYKNDMLVRQYPVSTSKYGAGNTQGSNKTPLGQHMIVSKVGRNARMGEIFQSRRRTRRIAGFGSNASGEDHITTRIMRLAGLERGINKGKGIDSFKRCIYIHGTPHEHLIGTPASHGCIRMKNKDIIALFEIVPRNTLVTIIT
jgi:hypothetical protein